MTGFITQRRHCSQQRLTREQKTGEGRLDSYPFFVGRHKHYDSQSDDSDSVLGRRSKDEHTQNMHHMCPTTYTARFVCVCALVPTRYLDQEVQKQNGTQRDSNAGTANRLRMLCSAPLLLLLYTGYHNGTTTVGQPTLLVPFWYHERCVHDE